MSHLGTLIERFRRDEELGEIPKDRLVNLAEYMTYYRPFVDYSEEEMRAASKILQDYKLASLIGREDLIERELENPRKIVVKCRRCGRPLWDPESVRHGIGPVCIKCGKLSVVEVAAVGSR